VESDQSFDGIAQKFAKNIYGTTKGIIREQVLWQDLKGCLARLPEGPLRILDAGGGLGQFSCKLAELGHEVVLCDLSQEMLSLARQELERAGVAERVTLVHSAIQDYLAEQPPGQFDLILCHAVLEWLAEPKPVVVGLIRALAPCGILSLTFYNKNAMLFHNLICGNFGYVKAGLKRKKRVRLTPGNPLYPEQVYDWIGRTGAHIIGKTGVRCFHDYLRDKQHQQHKLEELLQLEQRYARQEPYVSLGRYVHVMVQQPSSRKLPPRQNG